MVELCPVSFAQQRLWFLDQLEPGTCAYNLPTAIRIRGTLDVDWFSRALTAIIRRHDSLRTTFTSVDGQAIASIQSDPDPSPCRWSISNRWLKTIKNSTRCV